MLDEISEHSADLELRLGLEQRSGLPGLGGRPQLHPAWAGKPIAADRAARSDQRRGWARAWPDPSAWT
jgi:hypothetical protein